MVASWLLGDASAYAPFPIYRGLLVNWFLLSTGYLSLAHSFRVNS